MLGFLQRSRIRTSWTWNPKKNTEPEWPGRNEPKLKAVSADQRWVMIGYCPSMIYVFFFFFFSNLMCSFVVAGYCYWNAILCCVFRQFLAPTPMKTDNVVSKKRSFMWGRERRRFGFWAACIQVSSLSLFRCMKTWWAINPSCSD